MNAFDVMEGLLILEQNNIGISEFFRDNNVKKVIVYGLGRIGRRTIAAIKKKSVEVVAVIDQDAENMEAENIKLITPNEISLVDSEADLIIVTPTDDYYDIKEELEQNTKVDIISIAEIVEYCLNGESKLDIKVKRNPKEAQDKRIVIDHRDRSRYILIFGGDSGIGKAIAKRMVADGAQVVVAGRSEEKLSLTKSDIPDAKLHTLHADITQIESHSLLFEKAFRLMGGLDAFVNTAAISLQTRGRGYEPWDITSEEWDEVSDIDLKAAFFLMKNEVEYFRLRNIAGNILNFSSNAAYMDITGLYGAAKLSLIRWTRAFGKRFGHERIIINGIAPGATFTPIISAYAKSENQPYPRHAIGRFIKAEEIAELAHFCLSEQGVILCGTTILADGGDAEAF